MFSDWYCSKYKDLETEVRRTWHLKTTLTIIIGALEISRGASKNVNQTFDSSKISGLQKIILIGPWQFYINSSPCKSNLTQFVFPLHIGVFNCMFVSSDEKSCLLTFLIETWVQLVLVKAKPKYNIVIMMMVMSPIAVSTIIIIGSNNTNNNEKKASEGWCIPCVQTNLFPKL